MDGCRTGVHPYIAISVNAVVDAGLHQIVLQFFNAGGGAQLYLTILYLDSTPISDQSSSLLHDPAGPCNADCAVCNVAQQYCMKCTVPALAPVAGVCTSPFSVAP